MFPTDFKVNSVYLDELTAKYLPPVKTADEKFQAKLKRVSEEAYWEAQKQFLKTAYLRQMVCDLAEGKIEDYAKLPAKQLQMLQQQCDNMSSKSPYWFITVNPRSDIELSQFQKTIEKLLKKKCITNYAMAYEVRKKEGKTFKGLHCHIVLSHNIKPYDFKRSVKNTVKHITNVNNPEILNFKNLPTQEIVQEKILYITGNKSDKKQKGVAITKEWRKLNNLDEIYESNPPLPCRVAKKTIQNSE